MFLFPLHLNKPDNAYLHTWKNQHAFLKDKYYVKVKYYVKDKYWIKSTMGLQFSDLCLC